MNVGSDSLGRERVELLNEVSSVGAKNAALVLSKMLGTQISVTFPKVELITLDELLDATDYREKPVSFVFSHFHGDVRGTAALIFPEQSTLTILKSLFDRDVPSIDKMDSIDYSIIKETGNILIGSFLNAMCNTFDLVALPTVPDVAVDFLEAVLDSFSLVLCQGGREDMISIRTELLAKPSPGAIFGVMLILFDPSVDVGAIFGGRRGEKGRAKFP